MSLSRYPRYPAYKDSGVEWLGEVPAHWEVRRLRNTVKSCQNGTWGADPNGDDDAICVRVADFDRLRFSVRLTEPTFRSIPRSEFAHKRLACGDLLLEKSGGGENQPVGAVVQFDHEVDAVCSNFVASMPVAEGHVSRYLAYLHASLYSIRVNTRHIKQSTGIQNLDADGYLAELVPIPTLKEQTEISLFLDRETARIDALIDKKRKLIELLQEQRAAIITRAVTRGLDPHVPMKDSGVEWLGEIPAHWDVRRLKFLARVPLKYGASESADLNDPELPRFIRITDITDQGQLRDDTFKSLPEDVAQEFLLADGDILLARSGATAGKSFLYRENFGRAAYAGYLIRMRSEQELLVPEFLRFYTASTVYWRWISANTIQSTIPNVSAEKYASLLVPLPTVEEQRAITYSAQSATAQLDQVTQRIDKAVRSLLELRSSLITAAVTGAIDVRTTSTGPGDADAA